MTSAWAGKALASTVLVSFLAAGCGGANTGAVSGTVTYKGKPVENGVVTFWGADNRAAFSPLENGTYRIADAPVGPVKITVQADLPAEEFEDAPLTPQTKKVPKKRPPPAVKPPSKYADPEKSGLTFTVQPGSQEHNIALDSK
jgi:hypothetical protein